jgi:hypothetical protein
MKPEGITDLVTICKFKLSFIIIFRREEMIEIIKVLFAKIKDDDLPIFLVDDFDTKNITTYEKDKKKGKNYFPKEDLRSFDEDFVKKKKYFREDDDSRQSINENLKEYKEV